MNHTDEGRVKEITLIRSCLKLVGATKGEQEKGEVARGIIHYYTHDGKVILTFDTYHRKVLYVDEALI